MRKKSEKIVQKKAADVSAATAADLARLREAIGGPIDTSEIPERKRTADRLRRDSSRRLPSRG
jgi:hypothetical protein